MAETPVGQPIHDPTDRDPFADFNAPDKVLQRRKDALDLARQVQAADPSAANADLIRLLELDIAEHTPLDRPTQPPSPE